MQTPNGWYDMVVGADEQVPSVGPKCAYAIAYPVVTSAPRTVDKMMATSSNAVRNASLGDILLKKKRGKMSKRNEFIGIPQILTF